MKIKNWIQPSFPETKKIWFYINIFYIGKCVRLFHEENPEKIPWKDVPVNYVIDATGKFTNQESLSVNTQLIYYTRRQDDSGLVWYEGRGRCIAILGFTMYASIADRVINIIYETYISDSL